MSSTPPMEHYSSESTSTIEQPLLLGTYGTASTGILISATGVFSCIPLICGSDNSDFGDWTGEAAP